MNKGFWGIENGEFAWMSEENAEIECYIKKDNYNLDITLGPGIPFENLSFDEIPLQILINNELIDEIMINQNTSPNISFSISSSAINDGRNVIKFKTQMWSPAEYGATDTRRLGVPICQLTFTPQK